MQQFCRAIGSNCFRIVYGWINAGTVQRVQEAGPGQVFEVGYLKTGTGTLPQIELTVEDEEGTASMSSTSITYCDYACMSAYYKQLMIIVQ